MADGAILARVLALNLARGGVRFKRPPLAVLAGLGTLAAGVPVGPLVVGGVRKSATRPHGVPLGRCCVTDQSPRDQSLPRQNRPHQLPGRAWRVVHRDTLFRRNHQARFCWRSRLGYPWPRRQDECWMRRHQ
jgi:hypothetical protein